MPVARCPRCESPVTIDVADLGHDVECPTCRAVFATDDVLGPPTAPRSRRRDDFEDEDEDDFDRPRRRRRRDDPEDIIADARREVFLPWLLASIVAVLSMGYHFVDMIFVIANPGFLQNNPFGGGPIPYELYIAARLFAMVYVAVILVGLGQMMRMKTYGFARTVMILQMIPCAGVCCLVSLPLGIWGLVVLNRPHVREAFELAAGSRGGSWDRG